MQVETNRIRLTGAITRRGPYMDKNIYEILVKEIVTIILNSPAKVITIDELAQAVTANPPINAPVEDLPWITLQVKNDLVDKKLLISSFENYTQRIQLSREGKREFGLTKLQTGS